MRHKRNQQPVTQPQRQAPFVVRWVRGEESVKSLGFLTEPEADAEFERLKAGRCEVVLSNTVENRVIKSC
jgi:hypothetical protein